MNPQPFSRFVMIAAMRSGSNLLESYLNQYKRILCHGELFQRSFIGTLGTTEFMGMNINTRDADPQRFLETVFSATPDKITGFRLFQEHDQRVTDMVLKDRFCAKIILTRNPLESYVSLKIARKTGQWLVWEDKDRKNAQIHFDLDEYAEYLADRTAFYSHIRESLRLSEQPFFEIDYSMLNDVSHINRLAAFVGDKNPKSRLDQTIIKQNPGSLASKISNIDEVRAALDAPDLHGGQPPIIKPVLESGTDLSRAYFCMKLPLVFGPVPGVPDIGVRTWMEAQDKRVPRNGFTTRRFIEWQAQHKNMRFFSVVRHPVLRAYNAFMNKIFATAPDGYLGIRKALEDQFGMFLPQGQITATHNRRALEQSGYGVDEHRINFKLFLVFVAANLNNETKIRQDGKWQLQSEIIRRYRILHPEVMVLKEKSLDLGLQYLENRLNLPSVIGWKNELDPAYPFPIAQLYDDEVEHLARAAYGPDYKALDYPDLSGL